MTRFRTPLARLSRKAWILAAVALATLVVGGSVARGEIARKGNLLVTFSANLTPSKLPRNNAAPVGLQMGGKIRATDRTEPPALKRMVLQINRHGQLSTRGLPICNPNRLTAATTDRALAMCKGALVGRGNATTRLSLPGQGTFAENGRMLAFNTKVRGRPAIVAHIHGGRKLLLTYTILFRIKKTGKGQFGTSLIGDMPSIAGGQGRISAFNLSLRRNFRFRGRRASYASAKCPLPAGFRIAPVPLARVTYQFDDGRSVGSVLRRTCRVRGR